MWVWFLGWKDSPGGENGSPLQYSCLENPMDRGARWATVHGVMKSHDPPPFRSLYSDCDFEECVPVAFPYPSSLKVVNNLNAQDSLSSVHQGLSNCSLSLLLSSQLLLLLTCWTFVSHAVSQPAVSYDMLPSIFQCLILSPAVCNVQEIFDLL